MSVNPNKHKMNAQEVILNFCNMDSSSSNDEYSCFKTISNGECVVFILY